MPEEKIMNELLSEAWKKRGAGKPLEAKSLVLKAHELCNENNYKLLGRVYYIYMQLEADIKNYEQAVDHSYMSLWNYMKLGDVGRIAHANRHLADMEFKVGNIAQAEIHYLSALMIYREYPNLSELDLANALRAFGLFSEGTKDYEDAIEAWEEAKEIYQKYNIKESVEEAEKKIDALKLYKNTLSDLL